MKTVRIIKNYEWWDFARQTPGQTGEWGGVRFVVDEPGECDYLVVLNFVFEELFVRCPRENMWMIMHEPPNETSRHTHEGSPDFALVLHQDESISSPRHEACFPARPWMVDRTYDQLVALEPMDKPHALSWITSNREDTDGHRKRMNFLRALQQQMDFDLFGRGFEPIDDKWDALAPYRYTIAVENFENPWYWTEKIIDPLLAWTMPIYFGCTRIGEYLPEGSYVRFDPEDPDAPRKVREVVASDLYLQNRDAIAEARRRLLDEHNIYPFLCERIRRWEAEGRAGTRKRNTVLTNHLRPVDTGRKARLRRGVSRVMPWLSGRLLRQGWLKRRPWTPDYGHLMKRNATEPAK